MHKRQSIVDKMRSWLGCHEGDATHKHIIDTYNSYRPLPQGYRVKYTDAWCAATASAAAIECGYTDIIPVECSCNRLIELFQKMGCWVEDDAYTPDMGDWIFYDWQDDGIGDDTDPSEHVGVVEKVKDGKITVIEGNKSDGVNERTLNVNGKYIRGYGVPKYDDKPGAKTEVKPVRPSDKYQFGMDVSHYQGMIDYAKVKNAGIEFVCIRSTRGNGQTDQYFERNLQECINRRIDYSCYKYSYAMNPEDAKKEAQSVIKLLAGRKMMVWLDMEYDQQRALGKQAIEKIALAFISELARAGIQGGIYCYQSWYDNQITDLLKQSFLFWIARTGKDTGYLDEAYKPVGKNIFAWQYTHKGHLPGINGDVDLDVIL